MKIFHGLGNSSVAINAALKQIEIAPSAAAAFHKKLGDHNLPIHEGYNYLCFSYAKQKQYEDTIKIMGQAKQEGWNGDWDDRIKRYQNKKYK